MATIGAIEISFQSVANAAAIITFLGVVWGAFWLGIRSRTFWDNLQKSIKKDVATDIQNLLDVETEQIRTSVQQELSQLEERRNTRTQEAIEQIRTSVQQELSQLEKRRNTRIDALDNQIKGIDAMLAALRNVFRGQDHREGV